MDSEVGRTELIWHNCNIDTTQHTDLMTGVRFLAGELALLTLTATTLLFIGTRSQVATHDGDGT